MRRRRRTPVCLCALRLHSPPPLRKSFRSIGCGLTKCLTVCLFFTRYFVQNLLVSHPKLTELAYSQGTAILLRSNLGEVMCRQPHHHRAQERPADLEASKEGRSIRRTDAVSLCNRDSLRKSSFCISSRNQVAENCDFHSRTTGLG